MQCRFCRQALALLTLAKTGQKGAVDREGLHGLSFITWGWVFRSLENSRRTSNIEKRHLVVPSTSLAGLDSLIPLTTRSESSRDLSKSALNHDVLFSLLTPWLW